jgi:hypothetical protein
MINLKRKALVLVAVGLSTLATRADFRDNDLIGGPDKNINKNDGPVSGVFDLVTAGVAPDAGGFIPGSTVSSALAAFDFEANGNFVMSFDVTLDNILLGSGSTLANGPGSLSVLLDGSNANETAILAALSDGILNYKVTRTDANEGTLRFNFADLRVSADAVHSPEGSLPDGGATAILLGGGVSALTLFRRKLS